MPLQAGPAPVSKPCLTPIKVVVKLACTAQPNTAPVSAHKPDGMSTLATGWRDAIHKSNPGARKVRWEDEVEVSVVTLDSLIETYGAPEFCKIDVEGYELEVLAGLSRPVAGLSIEFVHGALEEAVACVRRIRELGPYRFNIVVGERRDFGFDAWATADEIIDWLTVGSGGTSSGDIYARLESLIPLVDLSLADAKSAERVHG